MRLSGGAIWIGKTNYPIYEEKRKMIKNVWPINPTVSSWDKFALKLGAIPGYCNVCGMITVFRVNHQNFREHVPCIRCKSVNRQRQIVAVLLEYLLKPGGNSLKTSSIKDIPSSTIIWNAETTRSLHKKLSMHLKENYISSEYINSSLSSGEVVNGVLHVDMQKTHFRDSSLDFILSGDVMEHVPFPLDALKETYRILKPNGCHIFTVPFYQHRFTNETRARVIKGGEIEYLRKPWYHNDPLRDEGALAYTVFAPELLIQLEQIGFEARLCILLSPFHGILGNNGLVIIARKAPEANFLRDWIFS